MAPTASSQENSSAYNALKDITSGTFGGVAQVLSGHRKFL